MQACRRVFQYLHLSHSTVVATVVADSRIAHVASFTGSVEGGKAIQPSAGAFWYCRAGIGEGPCLRTRADADLDYSIENLVDGSFSTPVSLAAA